jgi:hypothetical protein
LQNFGGYKENHKGPANICKQAQEIFEIFWPNFNLKELSRRTREKSVTVEIELQKWKWPGHTMGKDFSDIEKQAFIWSPQGPCTYQWETEKALEENSK